MITRYRSLRPALRMFFWPLFRIMLTVKIPLEAFIAWRFQKFDGGFARKISTVSNLVSTFIGFPLVWYVQMFFQSLRSPAPLPDSPGGTDWFSPWTSLVFFIFCFFVSVWSEYLTARIFVTSTEDQKRVLSWAWLANLLSFAPLFLWLLGDFVYYIVTGKS